MKMINIIFLFASGTIGLSRKNFSSGTGTDYGEIIVPIRSLAESGKNELESRRHFHRLAWSDSNFRTIQIMYKHISYRRS
ncbi:hypothetical protein D1D72_00380 [Salmonella enterica]|nr:hypothetical protein [Salmonella enterica]